VPASILVVDDDPIILETLAIHLRNAGYDVRTAKNGIDGGYAVLKHHPNLIITDAQMPYMDGFELVAALRSDASVCSIPVIMLTSHSEWQERGTRVGVDGYVTKPIRADRLLALVAVHLKSCGEAGGRIEVTARGKTCDDVKDC
jgi:DNA-binding response OmpR family regulator